MPSVGPMSSSQASILPIHHPSTGPRTAPPPGPFRPNKSSATHSTTSSAAASADPPSSGISPASLPLPESRTSSSTASSARVTRSSSTATAASNEGSQTTARESQSEGAGASATDDDICLPAGYPRLARKMGEMPEVAIFRRFGALNAQNLLYMQAELVCLERRLRELQAEDAAASEPPRSLYAANWFWLSNSEDHEDDDQWELVKEIRAKLKEYNEMLIQQMKIVSAEPPAAWDLRHIQRYLVSDEMDDGALTGKDANVWGSEEGRDPDGGRPDLVPLAARHGEDFFSSWVTERVSEKLIGLKRRRRPAARRKVEDFADKKMLRWTFMVASVLASALPVLAIAILYCVQSLKVRLGLIAVFNVLLSFALAWFTSAKRAEVFAVSAAFSAVQVVFVQVGVNDTQGAGV